jgi:mono/diheme cytochrome c family protein
MRACLCILSVIASIGGAGIGNSQEMQKSDKIDIGKIEFERNCSICHGTYGRGDGPYATTLNIRVPDLTMLSERNSGTFPFQRVYDTIDGTNVIKAHGTREMPIWGQTYKEKAEENYFNRRAFPWDAEPFVRARILALTEYVARLQVNQAKTK